MTTVPGLGYIHRFLPCRNSHAIPLPRPSLLETDDNLQQKAMENRRAVFVCPYCGLVSAYFGREIVEHLVGTPSLFQLGECNLVSIEIECDGKNCEAQKVVHTIAGTVKGTWRPRVVPKDWQFSESALCGTGHRLRFDEPLRIHLQGKAR
jgi:hypothetical protein